mmetsp:Transcript_10255/g.33850  ORF Transcript_10255/g.33850 Transcript_10255/m.33850 type:complete len:333 (+) Transcript_10255:14200-15198(+)|eukprot:scaffold544_cov117-Isochrysis_galbana.AAC.9
MRRQLTQQARLAFSADPTLAPVFYSGAPGSAPPAQPRQPAPERRGTGGDGQCRRRHAGRRHRRRPFRCWRCTVRAACPSATRACLIGHLRARCAQCPPCHRAEGAGVLQAQRKLELGKLQPPPPRRLGLGQRPGVLAQAGQVRLRVPEPQRASRGQSRSGQVGASRLPLPSHRAGRVPPPLARRLGDRYTLGRPETLTEAVSALALLQVLHQRQGAQQLRASEREPCRMSHLDCERQLRQVDLGAIAQVDLDLRVHVERGQQVGLWRHRRSCRRSRRAGAPGARLCGTRCGWCWDTRLGVEVCYQATHTQTLHDQTRQKTRARGLMLRAEPA